MNLTEKIGEHTIEIRTSSMGSINPWLYDILTIYHISTMGTADMRDYIRYDGKIYSFENYGNKVTDIIQYWKELYDESPEEVENEIEEWLKKNTYYKHGGYTLNEILEKWDIKIVSHLEFIRNNLETFKVAPEVFNDMCTIFGCMVNKKCHLPVDKHDVIAANGYILMAIPVNSELIYKVNLIVGKGYFKYIVSYKNGTCYFSDALNVSDKKNIDEFIKWVY